MNLYLLNFNNYYNRTVKKFDTLSDYLEYQIGDTIQGVNFIPNDYISSQQIINWSPDNSDPDYMLCVNEDGTIDSRWYVISTSRTRGGQLQLDLYRDVVSDYYKNIINAPCFIEKATINSMYDPAIYNREDMTFNQIKLGEYPLKDKSNVAWIVGYVPRDSFPDETKISTNYTYQGSQDITVNKLSDYAYYEYAQNNVPFIGVPFNVNYLINTYGDCYTTYPGNNHAYYDFSIGMDKEGNYTGLQDITLKNRGIVNPPVYTGDRTYRYKDPVLQQPPSSIPSYDVIGNFTSEVMSIMNQYSSSYLVGSTEREYNEFISQDNKVIFSKEDGQYYRVHVTLVNEQTQTSNINVNSSLYNIIMNNINKNEFVGTPNNETFQIRGTQQYYTMSLELLNTEVSTNISASNNRYHLNDSPYDMFCIPFPAADQTISIYKNGTLYVDKIDRAAAFNIAISVANSSGSGNIYDVQLLPYCPLPQIIKDDGTIDIGDTLNSDINISVGNSNKIVNVLMWCITSQFKLQIPFSAYLATTPTELKIQNETEFWRLCSPNYSGLFEFSVAKNKGIDYITVDCNYKPFNPYIHAAINFKNLYGAQYNDSRGLICGGDFSLPQTTSAWADYQLNNKNYQQMFDREIQNMEVNNSVQKEREAWSVASGALGAGVQGAMAGMMTGNPAGALVGLGTGLFSGLGGIRDMQLNEQLRNEALDYKRDMFGYQLGNIKALPQGLAKVSAFTANNKIFPFLEKYGCTSVERQALRDKLNYNGMTIMRIGTISQFLQPEPSYIKGRIIRIDSIDEDYHIINAIADEIYKGVFIN